MTASSPIVCHAQNNPGIHTAIDIEDEDSSLAVEALEVKTLSPVNDRVSSTADKSYCCEQFSSSPSISPRASTSPRTTHDADTFTQDSEPVPYSSTPDLGSRASSSSPNSDYDSQVVVTPPEEKFIRTLDRKLQALINAGHGRGLSHRYCSLDGAYSDYDERSHALGPAAADTDSSDTTSSSVHSAKSLVSLKRKRSESRTRDTPAPVETSVDEDTEVEEEDRSTHPAVPVSKKIKETSFNYSATEAASARRARSLSACSSHVSLVPTELASLSRPCTPVYRAPAVPIIAPPDFSAISRPPLSPDDAAEVRLQVLLQKERILRRHQGFEKGINDIFDGATTKEQVDDLLGIDEEFRKEVIAWMLRVTPSKKLGVNELRHQLRTCPETRFHAVLLFTRYFIRVGDAMPVATERETPLMRLGRKRIIWDVAMSCLALAVKFNRDFLCPFSPVYAREFLVLAPHPMSHDDFEISQKDVLVALDYEIRDITPGPFMEEIWASLSSLRKLLSFTDGWEITQMNAWHIVNAAATASEMLQFPMSLLTAAALIEGAVATLIDICEQDLDVSDAAETAGEEAEASVANVVKDINELTGISSVDMKRCRRWLQKIIRAAY